MSKFQKLAKLRKKLSKKKNLLNFNAKKTGLSFLTFDTKIVFNCLWLIFIKVSIFQYYNPKYYI